MYPVPQKCTYRKVYMTRHSLRNAHLDSLFRQGRFLKDKCIVILVLIDIFCYMRNFNSNFLRLENLPGLEQTALRKSLAKSASISVSVSVFEVDTSSADLSFSFSYSL